MRGIMFDVLEVNIVVAVFVVLLGIFGGKIRKRYGAAWLKLIWLVLAVRLLIPYNFSLPDAQIRLFNMPGFEQEKSVSEGLELEEIQTGADNIQAGAKEANVDWEDVQIGAGVADIMEVSGNTAEESGLFGVDVHYVFSPENEAESEYNTQSSNENILQEDVSIVQENYAQNSDVQDGTMQGDNAHNNTTYNNDGQNKNHFRYSDILLFIWVAGIIISGTYYAVICFKMRHDYGKNSRELAENELQNYILSLQQKYLGHAPLTVYESEFAKSPVIMGMLRPKLFIPALNKEWDKKELEFILAHELCHYRKKDLWLKIIMLVACCINWFNPAVYFMKKRFYQDMELVCDDAVMRGCSDTDRENYAKLLLKYATKQGNQAFTTGFAGENKMVKERIHHIWETRNSKKGIVIFAVLVVAFLGVSVLISCGYKPEETAEGTGQENTDLEGTTGQEELQENTEALEVSENFSYNNEHNPMVRIHEGVTYVGMPSGIYKAEGEELECLYENEYTIERGLCIYKNHLYFTGSIGDASEHRVTVYCMNLDTLETENVLSLFSEDYKQFFAITIQDENLYVQDVMNHYIGFKLDETGMAVERLDEKAEDFLYLETNKINEAYLGRFMYSSAASAEACLEEYKQSYYPIIDEVGCKEMLDGRFVVSKYKNEALRSIYLADGSGNYMYMCDAPYHLPVLVTETGIYYSPDFGEDIYFMDYDGSEEKSILQMDEEWRECYLINYDATYLYFTVEMQVDWREDTGAVLESYIMRVPRNGGEYEAIYKIENENNIYLYSDCSIDERYMYFHEAYDGRERILLEPVEQDEDTRKAYAAVLRNLLYSNLLPDNSKAEFSVGEYSQFAIADIDRDGKEELVVLYDAGVMAAMRGYIIGYDRQTEEIYIQLSEFPFFAFLSNGNVKALSSHNQTYGEMWPYIFYQYNSEKDIYEEVGYVHSEDKAMYESIGKIELYPQEADVSGTGTVYYIGTDAWGETPVDEADYLEWLRKKEGDAQEIEIEYYTITEENISEILEQNTWQSAYLEILQHLQDNLAPLKEPDGTDYRSYAEIYNPQDVFIYLGLHDFDDDGIMELIVGDTLTMAVFTYRNGQAEKIADLYYPDSVWCINGVYFKENSISLNCDGSGGSNFVNYGYLDGEYKLGFYSELILDDEITINGEPATREEVNQIYTLDWEERSEDESKERIRLVWENDKWVLKYFSGEEVILDENFDFNSIVW